MATKKKLLRGRIKIGVKADGSTIYKNVSGHSREELEIAKQAAREHYVYGRQITGDSNFAQYAEEWYLVRKEPFISNGSKASYKVCFLKHLLPEFGLRQMKAISANQLQAFVNKYAGSSKSQITMIIGTIKAVFTAAYADGVIDRNPSVALIHPKAGKAKKRRSLTYEERENVITAMHTHPEGPFLAVLYYLGVRRGEALGLKWGDFDWDRGKVHIQRDIDYTMTTACEDTLKTDAADRYIPIPEELHEILAPLKEDDNTYVFNHDGKPLSQTSFKRMWVRLMAACGFAEWRDSSKATGRTNDILKQVKPTITPHYFRHNYVTMLYEAGIDPFIAMKIVGHTDYQTTANIYTHLSEDTLQKASIDLANVFHRTNNAATDIQRPRVFRGAER